MEIILRKCSFVCRHVGRDVASALCKDGSASEEPDCTETNRKGLTMKVVLILARSGTHNSSDSRLSDMTVCVGILKQYGDGHVRDACARNGDSHFV